MAAWSPALVLNPPEDAEFVAEAKRLVAAGANDAWELETSLRQRYPRAIVHLRGLAGEGPVVFYVYRDGRWMPHG